MAFQLPSYELLPMAHNWKTNQFEPVDFKKMPAERLREFIPQDRAVQGFFTWHLELGETPLRALLKTLEALIGIIELDAG